MAKMSRPQRVRDPIHNLIEFDGGQFESMLWRVIQTRPFQRLRRIRQLGFSELVYPGATHTRFAHSLGVFHTARRLMRIIRHHIKANGGYVEQNKADVAVAAALVHDLGHGMLSHAFEDIGEKLGLKMAHHEHVSDVLIRDGEVARELATFRPSFPGEVADVIGRGRPTNLYDAVVSSQFDADRLDYMQRDRLMAGVQNSGIDFEWLLANLEIGTVATGVDGQQLEDVETFVLGPKAIRAAETYVLALFQLYPTVYHHKATRAAEKLFSALMIRLITLMRDGAMEEVTGLSARHPFARFAKDADSVENALALDDTVFWGSLGMLCDAKDAQIRECAIQLRDRKLPKSVDIRGQLVASVKGMKADTPAERNEIKRRLNRLTENIENALNAWSQSKSTGAPRILVDREERVPYKLLDESKGPLNQIRIKTDDGQIRDMAEVSSVVSSIETFKLFRAYIKAGDHEAKAAADAIVAEELGRTDND
ncbi:HD domain-containing protein [Azospirillum sp. YIM B02556]|uniref:HD domain-containing protein n=1 Tax=Azospirillum endophyticum TaxID=2800326 RepID=A0ABS1F8I1_9PROT|nr:HD domain-containing protein [Azospirillum endophyticum]MBK1839710.1 HD domain-containing protein [Azospirillum endophyticum]